MINLIKSIQRIAYALTDSFKKTLFDYKKKQIDSVFDEINDQCDNFIKELEDMRKRFKDQDLYNIKLDLGYNKCAKEGAISYRADKAELDYRNQALYNPAYFSDFNTKITNDLKSKLKKLKNIEDYDDILFEKIIKEAAEKKPFIYRGIKQGNGN